MKTLLRLGMILMGIIIMVVLFDNCTEDSDPFIEASHKIELREKKDKCKVKVITPPTIKATLYVELGDVESPPIEAIESVADSIQKAADAAQDSVVKKAYEEAKKLITEPGQADSIKADLSEPDVAGIHFPSFYYEYKGNEIIIVVINIQILEFYPPIIIQQHEDGHSHITNEITKKATEKLAKKEGKDCKEIAEKDVARIRDLINSAQQAYDQATDNGKKGDQGKEAKKAVNNALKGFK